MCGIVAFHGPRSAAALDLVQACLLEAAVRGTHATGLAWLEDGQIHVERAPVSAREFVSHFDLSRLAEGERDLRLVAHTRYSTSDLAWNQPLDDAGCAMVMNGVVSQDTPDKWPLADVGPYETGNDVEVAMRHALLGIRGLMPGSFAIVELHPDGTMLAYRNAYRPLYHARAEGGTLVASTTDMIRRAGRGAGRMVVPGFVFDLESNAVVGDFPAGHEQQPPAADPRALRCKTE
jgi:glutamine phosphoribosylpyrophosphate amidotransferase